jgi:hypothetical protein
MVLGWAVTPSEARTSDLMVVAHAGSPARVGTEMIAFMMVVLVPICPAT